MHLSVDEQSEIFAAAVLFGAALGVFYDLFRLLRALGFRSRAAVFAQDVLFMMCCGVLCFLFAQTTVHGRFRSFTFIGHVIGLAGYRFSIGVFTGAAFRAAAKVLHRAARLARGIVKR